MVWFPQHPRRFMHAMQQVHIQPEPSQFDAPKRIYRRCQKRSEGVHHINTLPESRPRETARLRAMQPATPAGEDACMAYRRRICARLGLIPLRVSHTDSNRCTLAIPLETSLVQNDSLHWIQPITSLHNWLDSVRNLAVLVSCIRQLMNPFTEYIRTPKKSRNEQQLYYILNFVYSSDRELAISTQNTA